MKRETTNLHTSRPHLKQSLGEEGEIYPRYQVWGVTYLGEEGEIVPLVRSVRLALQSVPSLLALHVRYQVPIPARDCSVSRLVHKEASLVDGRTLGPRIDLPLDQVEDFVLPARWLRWLLRFLVRVRRGSSRVRAAGGGQVEHVHRLIVHE